ncbi:MAG: hypothetical protein ACK5JF_02690 [Oscillospiraceae bacterium]
MKPYEEKSNRKEAKCVALEWTTHRFGSRHILRGQYMAQDAEIIILHRPNPKEGLFYMDAPLFGLKDRMLDAFTWREAEKEAIEILEQTTGLKIQMEN